MSIGTVECDGRNLTRGDHEGAWGVAIIEGQWRSRGACQGLDPEIFYPDNDDHADVAKAVCEECQVRIACLNHALDNREHQGVWGGATARERRRLLRQRRRIA